MLTGYYTSLVQCARFVARLGIVRRITFFRSPPWRAELDSSEYQLNCVQPWKLLALSDKKPPDVNKQLVMDYVVQANASFRIGQELVWSLAEPTCLKYYQPVEQFLE